MDNEFDIAIVGMAGRFPGARNLAEFWKNLAHGVDSITRLSDQDLAESGLPAAWLSNPAYVKAAPLLEEPGQFDAAFFGYSPAEARTMDPQHRILLELGHEALEHAGCDPERYPGQIGVFTGAALNTYFMTVGLASRLAEDYIPTLIGNDKDFLSTRLSYKLNLKGPSITIQTACSTSLVALHLARQSLLTGESDMALAGAVSVRVPHRAGYFHDSGGVVSPDGQVRAFDARANGTVFGSGGGIVALKRLADALADGDTIHAVIKGSAVNNDGSEKAGYTAPSVASQADVVVEALANAGLTADSISYVEAHGSGTPVGDPVELRALTKAFRTSTPRCGYCAIGSVKTNIGHLDAAAGIAGLIKTVLALEHRMLPPSLHFTQANPEIDFPATPFFVNARLRDWVSEQPRRAGVMSTGMGGTNAHVVLEEAPTQAAESPAARTSHLLVLSARTESALDVATQRLREFVENAGEVNMADVAHTLQAGRKALPHRRYLVCSHRQDAIAGLGRDISKRALSGRAHETRRPVILLLPGIGDHYVGMAHELYEAWPVFRDEIDRCAQILEPLLGIDIRTILYPAHGSWKSRHKGRGIDLKKMLGRNAESMQQQEAGRLNRTIFAQPILFTIEYAASRLWQSLGVAPDAIVGHSLGEYVAACLAGVLSLDDALWLVATRARLVDELPQGAMLAVALTEGELRPLLPADLSVSVINGPRLCVVAGPAAAVSEFEKTLNAKSVICRHVQNGHAFHSKMLDPIAKTLEREVGKVRLTAPAIPYISNVTGTWITRSQATDPAYWAMHATRTARFSDALGELWHFTNPILLEAGPGRTLALLAMQHPDRRHGGDALAVSSIRHEYENQSDVEFLWNAIGRLWLAGVGIRWEKTPSRGRKLPLPSYPFERQTFWMEPMPPALRERQAHEQRPPRREFDDWFYVPVWKRAPFLGAATEMRDDAFWLIFADRYGGGERIKAHLEARGCAVAFVRFGDRFAWHGDRAFQLNPGGIGDYLKLFEALEAHARPKAMHIVHLGSVTREDLERSDHSPAASQDFGFYSLLHVAQALGELNVSVPVSIGVVSNRLHEVTGEERLAPEMATVLGPCGVIPKEFPNVKCFNIDLPDEGAIDSLSGDVIARIVSEFAEPSRGDVVAYRGRYRWQRDFEPVVLAQAPMSDHLPRHGRLRPNGVYLITGGTGGIGLSISKYLAQACRPVIVLTKKSAFPDRSEWNRLSLTRGAPPHVLRTIDALMEIEGLGAQVDVQAAEISDRAQMENVLRSTRERYGTINGVIHAAGIVSAELILSKSRATAHGVLAPKVYGTMILLDLLKNASLDFLVLFSSITAIETPYAHCDYSAANCFLDACAYAANAQRKFHTLTINWPGWKETGQLADLETAAGLENWKKAALEKAITTRDGTEAFARALNSGLKQIIVSPEDLGDVLARARLPLDPRQYLSPTRSDGAQAAGPATAADAATNEVEAALADIWRSVLGLEQVGVHDSFSSLGGHSLLAMQIVSKARALYEIRLSLREFFEAPTIAELSSLIQAKILADIERLTDDQARQLASQE